MGAAATAMLERLRKARLAFLPLRNFEVVFFTAAVRKGSPHIHVLLFFFRGASGMAIVKWGV